MLATSCLAAIPDETENTSINPNNFDFGNYDFGANELPLTCDLPIKRSIIAPYDFNSIIGSGKKFEDTEFFAANTDMIIWPNYRKSGSASLTNIITLIAGYYSPLDKDPKATLFGAGIVPQHIIQGSIGDCYMISVLASIAEYPDRIKKIFRTQQLNKEGIVAMNVFIKGRP